jgi:hypothetical protein
MFRERLFQEPHHGMSGKLVYVMGYPGCGKTTATALALGGDAVEVRDKPFKHIKYADGLVQLGMIRESYGGTDALPMNVQPAVVQWLAQAQPPRVVGEGDRLANGKFFHAVLSAGFNLTVVYLAVPELLAQYRAWRRGSRFVDSWFRGRITKVNRLVSAWGKYTVVVDGTAGQTTVAGELRAIINAEA